MHRYPIENLSIKREFLGLEFRVEVTCDIEIKDWHHTPADPGVPYNGGANAPEPSHPESWDIQDWEVMRDSLILWIIYRNEDVMEIELAGLPPEEQEKIVKIAGGIIMDEAPWEKIGEWFNEKMKQ